MPDGQGLHAMTRPTKLVWIALLAGGLACTEKGRSLVLIDLTTTVTPLAHVRVVVAKNGDYKGETTAPWNDALTTLPLGVYVPNDVSGTVTIHACGFNEADTGVAANTMLASASVSPGETTPVVAVELNAGPLSSLCGNGSGTGGKGGTTGTP